MQVQVLNKESTSDLSTSFSRRSIRNALRSSLRSLRSKSPPPTSPVHSTQNEEGVVPIKLPMDPFDTSKVQSFICNTFPGSILLEQHQVLSWLMTVKWTPQVQQSSFFLLLCFSISPFTLSHSQGSVTYQIPSEGVTWSQMFKEIEANKERLNIIDYSVSQTTLDQVRHRL